MELTALSFPLFRLCSSAAIFSAMWVMWWMAAEGNRPSSDDAVDFSLVYRKHNTNNNKHNKPPLVSRHVVVTGGAGYIGSHAAERLLDLGHVVTIVDDLSRGNVGAVVKLNSSYPGRVRFVLGDVGNRQVVREALLGGVKKADLVIHFAAVAYVGESIEKPLLYYRNITVNSLVLVEEMLRFKVHRLVYSSTCAVYGSPPSKHLPATEDTPLKPLSPYGSAKLMVEDSLRDVSKANPKFKVGILRYFNVYGCDPKGGLGEWPNRELQVKHGRITNACLDAAQNLTPAVHLLGTNHPTPDGTVIRDFIHVADLVEAHIAVVPKIANPPVLYNVGTGSGVSMFELLAACKKATGVNFTVTSRVEGRPGDSPTIYADPTKIQTELGWSPKYPSIETGLSHCWRWRQRHSRGY